MTGDRSSFIGRNGTLADPLAMEFAHLPGRVGAVLDPCGAVQTKVIVAARRNRRGDVPSRRRCGRRGGPRPRRRRIARPVRSRRRCSRSWTAGTTRLSAVEVETPDAALNILTNRWLGYQTLSCRFHARSAFYQSGGAFGFRDQLQDVLAFLHFDAGIARAASSFARRAGSSPKATSSTGGTSPAGKGSAHASKTIGCGWCMRRWSTRGSRATGTCSTRKRRSSRSARRTPTNTVSTKRPVRLNEELSIYEHCTRAIARTMQTGVHGLPLMGTGDWNDGMDEVGEQGRGESVWLGWFLASLLGPFAALADRRGRRPAGRCVSRACRRTQRRSRRRMGRRVVSPRLFRRWHAAGVGSEHRVPHRRHRTKLVGDFGTW